MSLGLSRGATPTLAPPRSDATTHWDRAATAVAVLVALPILSIALTAMAGGAGGMAHAMRFVLPTALMETLLLLAGVLLIACPIGVMTGWLVASFDFPGRRVLGWALVLPFAVPTYIAAYAYVEALDYFGPVQGALRWIFGFRSRADYWFPELRSLPGAAFVTGLVLYPTSMSRAAPPSRCRGRRCMMRRAASAARGWRRCGAPCCRRSRRWWRRAPRW